MKTDYIMQLPVPACVVGTDGNIVMANAAMNKVILYEGIVGANFFTLTGVKREALINANSDRIYVDRNDRTFKLRTTKDVSLEEDIVVFFDEKTKREKYRIQLEQDQPAVMLINIDNFDELTASSNDDGRRAIPSQVDGIVRRWADEYDAPAMSTGDDSYVVFSTRGKVSKMIETEFRVLDDVRKIETQNSFPVSLSIGVGMSEESMAETTYLAEAALELALGRGGDQAVVKDGDSTRYYGGTLQTVEKNNNRGKARVIAHAMKRLIEEADRVLIMGHRWPDMDAFGASIAAYTICRKLNKEAYIIIDKHNDALDTIFEAAVETEDYNFIKPGKAIDMISEHTLLIIVDTNRPQLLESEEIASACKTKIIIDHHRLTDDSIQNAAIAYIESYASSASELMAELMEYFSRKRFINKFEAEAMLAGIMVDTNNFSGRTGVRTYEAASTLKRAGADSTEVKRFFQTEKEDFKAKASAIANAEFTDDGFAFAQTMGENDNTQIINAQVADELLMVKGVRATFVVGQNEKKQTVISARSLGEVNVQHFMEKFGGGGHFTSAAAQVDADVDEVIEKLNKYIKEYVDKEKEED
ncbi:MAG: DHH family phosphoesterase [Clostridiales bacterium]|nr:DHH family phosphoesterase [Candidatus Crickella caballi]